MKKQLYREDAKDAKGETTKLLIPEAGLLCALCAFAVKNSAVKKQLYREECEGREGEGHQRS